MSSKILRSARTDMFIKMNFWEIISTHAHFRDQQCAKCAMKRAILTTFYYNNKPSAEKIR